MSVDKLFADKMSVDKMSVDKMSVDKMSVDKMTCCHRNGFNHELKEKRLQTLIVLVLIF